MIAEKFKYFQGYVLVQLTGYAPERFFNLCSNRNILIWNLEYQKDHYRFCISVKGFKQLKPILKKTKTRLKILHRYGLPFFLHRYRKRKGFFLGILFCALSLYVMSLFIWNIEVQGNLHRTDSTILKFLNENQIHQGILKSRLDCAEIEELLRTRYDDVIWASAKIQGTRLILDIQENLTATKIGDPQNEDVPSDLIAQKDAEIYSIITRKGTPLVEKGSIVKKEDVLVEGKVAIYNDSAEIVNYQYCSADADILGITVYVYEDRISCDYRKKEFTGQEKKKYQLLVLQRRIQLMSGKNDFQYSDNITTENPLKIGKNFYLPISLSRTVSREYQIVNQTYTRTEAETIAKKKLAEFCAKLEKKGVQIIENNVMIETEGKICISRGELKVLEAVGKRQNTTIMDLQQEGQLTDESDGNDNQYTN